MEKIILNEIKRNLILMKLTEDQIDIGFNENNDEILKGYIEIIESEDSDPKNLNVEFIQNNRRFAKLLNTILYEIYKDNLDWNEDKSKYGIVDIYQLNDFTSWSVLNYFGGHKFVKNKLLDFFNRKEKGNTPKDFYRWLMNLNLQICTGQTK